MLPCLFFFFFFNDTATTEIYTLSLHDALPILHSCEGDAGVSVTRFHLSPQPRFRCHAGVLHETAGGRAGLEGPRDGNRCGPRETGGLRAGPAPVRASRRGGADLDLPRRRLQENRCRTQITWGEGDP